MRPCLLVSVLLLTGCALTGSPYQTQQSGERNSLRAQQLTQEAAALLQSDPAQAETLLREALAADIFHGPAHNNLGILYLKEDRLYEAATEFEWARKLMIHHPNPRLNLALTLEKAGRIQDAKQAYDSALEVFPDYLPAIQALCRLNLRHSLPDDRTREFLERIALEGDESWRQMAHEHLAKLR